MESMLPYIPVLVAGVIAVVFSILFVILARFFGPRKEEFEKLDVYECGVPVIGSARQRVSVKFYMVAILFILFDIEVVFLFPWAVVYQDYIGAGAGLFIFAEMMIFTFILFLGWVYALKRGALKWD